MTKKATPAKKPNSHAAVQMYATDGCPFCSRAKRLLQQRGVVDIDEISVNQGTDGWERMIEHTGRRTVPQIYIGDRHVGGYEELAELDWDGELTPLLFTEKV